MTSRRKSLPTRLKAHFMRKMSSSERESIMKTHTAKDLTKISTEGTIRYKLGSFRSLTTKSKVAAMVASNLPTPTTSRTTMTPLEEVKRVRESHLVLKL